MDRLFGSLDVGRFKELDWGASSSDSVVSLLLGDQAMAKAYAGTPNSKEWDPIRYCRSNSAGDPLKSAGEGFPPALLPFLSFWHGNRFAVDDNVREKSGGEPEFQWLCISLWWIDFVYNKVRIESEKDPEVLAAYRPEKDPEVLALARQLRWQFRNEGRGWGGDVGLHQLILQEENKLGKVQGAPKKPGDECDKKCDIYAVTK